MIFCRTAHFRSRTFCRNFPTKLQVEMLKNKQDLSGKQNALILKKLVQKQNVVA